MFVLVTGGSASGKSEYAEKRIMELTRTGENALYIATMQPFGVEGRLRVEKHRKQRAKRRFDTLEVYNDLEKADLETNQNVLLECMSNLVANEMFREDGAALGQKELVQKILAGIKHLSCPNLVIVTNEVFSDTMNYGAETVEYISCLGLINRELARLADEVVEVVYGIPVMIKGGELQ